MSSDEFSFILVGNCWSFKSNFSSGSIDSPPDEIEIDAQLERSDSLATSSRALSEK